MARTKLTITDQLLIWATTAELGEVEAQYRRIGAILTGRRPIAGRKRAMKRPAILSAAFAAGGVAE